MNCVDEDDVRMFCAEFYIKQVKLFYYYILFYLTDLALYYVSVSLYAFAV